MNNHCLGEFGIVYRGVMATENNTKSSCSKNIKRYYIVHSYGRIIILFYFYQGFMVKVILTLYWMSH